MSGAVVRGRRLGVVCARGSDVRTEIIDGLVNHPGASAFCRRRPHEEFAGVRRWRPLAADEKGRGKGTKAKEEPRVFCWDYGHGPLTPLPFLRSPARVLALMTPADNRATDD